jgi:HAD superfamily phosphoserine phosphatase-like hydrolase
MRDVIKPRSIEAVAFDADGTVTVGGNSWTALTRGLGASVDEHLQIYGGHIKGLISYQESRRRLIELWQSTGNANQQFIEDLQQTWPIRPEAYDVMMWLKQNGLPACLISSAAISYVEQVAKKLGVDDYYSSARLIFDDQKQLVDLEYTLQEAAHKVQHLMHFCQKYGRTLGSCAVVGDSGNDLEMFRATGNGFLIGDSQNEALIKAASRRITTLNEVVGALPDIKQAQELLNVDANIL